MKDIQKFVRKGILDLKAYIPGKPIEEVQEELGLTEIAKLASNETPLGPSPKAVLAAGKELI
ncbi:MAG: histidinol-phosphate transaminase, partial [Candidatus Aminicenantes bacterium]|nr:histidinol-phosphate transaminase [Candidatus Aminicenantes bacterium]